ncbi:hypothetical protein H0H93_004243 [Arthromyces matolae]|nr:hypothetical protein H0H93_004243 [Arthromyces matolae]
MIGVRSVLMDSDTLDLTSTPLFNKATYINSGKLYPDRDTPLEVLWERNRILAVPKTAREKFIPPATLPVNQFLALELPKQGGAFITSKPTTWFSDDEPTSNPLALLERPIPSPTFLALLQKEFGQAWFNGAQSILDPRYNNAMDRFPLWIITVWSEMVDVVDKQNTWRKAHLWLEDEAKLRKDPATLQELESVVETLKTLGWNAPITYTSVLTTACALVPLITTLWLSDDTINMLMEVL